MFKNTFWYTQNALEGTLGVVSPVTGLRRNVAQNIVYPAMSVIPPVWVDHWLTTLMVLMFAVIMYTFSFEKYCVVKKVVCEIFSSPWKSLS